MYVWAKKDPDEVLDYKVSWADVLEASETIATSLYLLVQGTVVFDSDDIIGESTLVWISGGTLNERCIITNRITTSLGRTYDATMRLRIGSK